MSNETNTETVVEVSKPTEPESYNNHSMNKRFQDLLKSKMSDVQFVFELDDEVVKVPSHKIILSASSPVFNAMFNGDLKEKGDVKIVDASPDAFKEFLQFFYEDQVKLTMDNIEYVMNLVNKYDVAECWPNCIQFLKENLTVDEVLWALFLALKFELNDLKSFCESQIQNDIEKVMEMFELGKNGDVSLSLNPAKRFIPEKDVKNLFVCVFAASKKVCSCLSSEVNFLREKCVIRITLSKDGCDNRNIIGDKETIYFKLDRSMLLTSICYSSIYELINNIKYENCKKIFQLIIKEKPSKSLCSEVIFGKDIVVSGGSRLKFKVPIIVKAEHIYAITLKTLDNSYKYNTDIATIPDGPIILTKNINISFPRVDGKPHQHSLIRSLQFREICED